MTKRTSIIMGGMAAAVALTAAAGAGAATTVLYGGGGTLAEKAYRDLFNAYGDTSSGELCANRPNCPPTPYNANVALLYVGVGSGNGLKAIDNNDPSLYVAGSKKPDATPTPSSTAYGTFYGTYSGGVYTPGTGVGPNFPKVTFSGSDDSLSATDVATAKTSLGNNPLVQIPGLITAIAVPFNPAANWKPHGVAVGGASSTVQLSTNTLCGIFTGAITLWSDAAIKADNRGQQLGTGTINVIYRHDGSGTTFLFTNALINQCGTTAHPNAHSTHPIPDQWLTDNSIAVGGAGSAPFYKSTTSFFINVFNAGHLPANFYNDNGGASGVTGGVSGGGAMKSFVLSTTGSIGYLSPDFVKPVDGTGPQAANLQTYASYNAGTTPSYRPPTAANAVPIMASSKPPAFPTAATNPLNWGALNPTPSGSQTYPIGGFTFIDLRRCYTAAADVAALVGNGGTKGFFTWYYGAKSVNNGTPASILQADGFAPVPAAWATAAIRLLTAPATGLNTPTNGACKYVTAPHGA